MKCRKSILLLIFVVIVNSLFSQDLDWWVKKHNLDGKTPWEKYILLSPGYMGPNALPVPELRQTTIEKDIYFQTNAETHFGYGDFTSNLFMKLYIPFKDVVAVESYIAPIEYFELDTNTRDERFVRFKDAKGIAGGDFYFGTSVQVIRDHEWIPDVLFSMSFKTASGTSLGKARFTDTPGYFFDVVFGKQKGNSSFSWMLGFYSWQTYDEMHRQNDAFLYGLGYEYQFEKFSIKNSIRGYKGYLKNGDAPLVYRFDFSTIESKILPGLFYQYGIFDYPYHSVGLTMKFNKN